MGLHHAHPVIPVDNQPRQPITFTMYQSEAVGLLIGSGNCLRKPCHPRLRKREGPIVRWEGSGAAGRFQGGAAARLLRQACYFGFGFDFDAEGEAGIDKGVDHVGGVMGGREGAVAALDDSLHTKALEPVHDGLRG